MPSENITPGTQPGDTHVIPAGAPGAVVPVTPPVASPASDLTLAALNQRLGKNFPDVETALKSIEDTNSYVGRKKEDIEREVLARVNNTAETNKLAQEIEGLRKDNFYRDNPQYAKPEVRALIEKFGGDPAKVVDDVAFKPVFEKMKGYDETQNLRTVLDSNPRLASSRDVLEKARESIEKSGRRNEATETEIANAILDIYK